MRSECGARANGGIDQFEDFSAGAKQACFDFPYRIHNGRSTNNTMMNKADECDNQTSRV
jgi:hypothetical protein